MKVACFAIALSGILAETGALAGDRGVPPTEKAVIEFPTESFQFQTLVAWDSHYGAEGRDSLDGDGLASILLEMDLSGWRLGSWFAEGTGADYEERNFYIERDFEWRGLEGYFGYKFLQFPGEDNESDNELGAGLSGPELPLGLVPEINWYYSADAGGSYLDAGLTREFHLTDQLQLIPSIFVGRNEGYVSDGHPGTDHVRFALETNFRVNDRFTIQAHVGKSIEINSDSAAFAGDALLRDFFHGGVGIMISF